VSLEPGLRTLLARGVRGIAHNVDIEVDPHESNGSAF